MNAVTSQSIDIVEAAYDLEIGVADWLPHLMKAGGEAFDLGHGVLAVLGTGITEEGQPRVWQLCTPDRSADLPLALAAAPAPKIEIEALLHALHEKVPFDLNVWAEALRARYCES